jgi:hypothetical protein
MKKAFYCLCIVLALSGCVTPPIPPDYSGPIATVRDSAQSETSSRAQFYYLSEIDGRPIENVLSATRRANQGKGFSIIPVSFARDIPAKSSTLTLEARIGYGAPIQEIINAGTVYALQRKITFTPKSNKTYVVKGSLSADRKEVWLEEAITGKRIE